MKTTMSAFDPVLHGADAARDIPQPAGFFERIKNAMTAMRQVHDERLLRAELSELDDHVLKDIGIADDELHRVRSREPYTPRSWRA